MNKFQGINEYDDEWMRTGDVNACMVPAID